MDTAWSDEFPDWRDTNEQVEVEMHDGRTVVGTLVASDVWFDGEDEVPIFSIKLDNGTEVGFADMKRWRSVS